MRILVTALFALSVLAGIAAPASAFDAKSLFGQLDHEFGRHVGFSGAQVGSCADGAGVAPDGE